MTPQTTASSKKQPAVLVEWTEHPKLRELLEWIAAEFCQGELRSLDSETTGYNLKDYKFSIGQWAERGHDRYEELIKRTKDLPDLEDEVITI
jgi:hypothetical protein